MIGGGGGNLCWNDSVLFQVLQRCQNILSNSFEAALLQRGWWEESRYG